MPVDIFCGDKSDAMLILAMLMEFSTITHNNPASKDDHASYEDAKPLGHPFSQVQYTVCHSCFALPYHRPTSL